MKKFLLFSVAVLFATATMAQHRSVLQKKWMPKRNLHTSLEQLLKDKAQKPGLKAISQLQAPKVQVQAARRADSDNAIDGIAQDSYIYSDLMGIVNYSMASGFKYYATDEKVYLAFPDLAYMEGTYVTDKANRYAAYGADSVRFELGTLAGTDSKGNKYVYAGTTLIAGQNSISATRNTNQYIGAYYFKEDNNLYIPFYELTDFVSVYPEDATKTEAVDYIWGGLDIFAQDDIQQYVSKATWTANDISFDDNRNIVKTPVSGEAKVYLTYYGYYVQGIYPIKDAWVYLEFSTDGTQAIIAPYQFLGAGEYPTDETGTTTEYVEFGSISVKSDFTGWADDYAKVFFVADDETTQTTTLMDDGSTTVSIYAYSETQGRSGIAAHLTDMNITITYEPAYTGIETVKTVKGAADANAPVYNLSGQRVTEGYKGMVIKNGKKVVIK